MAITGKLRRKKAALKRSREGPDGKQEVRGAELSSQRMMHKEGKEMCLSAYSSQIQQVCPHIPLLHAGRNPLGKRSRMYMKGGGIRVVCIHKNSSTKEFLSIL